MQLVGVRLTAIANIGTHRFLHWPGSTGRCLEGDLCGIKFGEHVSQVHLGERDSSLTAHGSADLLASGLAGVQDGNCVVDFRMWSGNNMSRDNFTDAATGRGA